MSRTKRSPEQTKKVLAAMHTLSSVIASRAKLSQGLGQSYGGDRKLYNVCGYPLSITFDQYMGRYKRQDIAKRIIDAYPNATWRGRPDILEKDRPEEADATDFEQAWIDMTDSINLHHYFSRVDKLAGVGQYAVLLLGYDDGGDWDQEVKSAKELLYVMPYAENHAAIQKKETKKNDRRYGLPLVYKITNTDPSAQGSSKVGTGSIDVHWSRVLHVADGCLESDVLGTPRLEACFNRLQDLEAILGGGAEMFWRGGYPGLAITGQEGVTMPDESDMEDEIESYLQGLSRVLKLQGVDVKSLDTSIEDPKSITEIEIMMLSAATGIPQRILTGSERGELASSQDENNWNSRVDERRHDFAEPMILREFINRNSALGVLPTPPKGYTIEWPNMQALSEKDQAEVGKTITEALQAYIRYPGADEIIPPLEWLVEVMGVPQEKAETMLEKAMIVIEEEEKDATALAEEEAKVAAALLKEEEIAAAKLRREEAI